MLCDDCTKCDASTHMGQGICICDECIRNFDQKRVLEKIKERNVILQKIADDEWVDFEILKKVPVSFLLGDDE